MTDLILQRWLCYPSPPKNFRSYEFMNTHVCRLQLTYAVRSSINILLRRWHHFGALVQASTWRRSGIVAFLGFFVRHAVMLISAGVFLGLAWAPGLRRRSPSLHRKQLRSHVRLPRQTCGNNGVAVAVRCHLFVGSVLNEYSLQARASGRWSTMVERAQARGHEARELEEEEPKGHDCGWLGACARIYRSS